MSILNLKIKLPEKEKSINLIKKRNILKNSLPVFCVGLTIITISILLLFIGGMPRYLVNTNKEKELLEKQQELTKCIENNKKYNEVFYEYLKYGESYKTTDEKTYIDRSLLLEKIEEYLIPCGAVMKLRVSGNTLITVLYKASMSDSSKLINQLINDKDNAIKYAATTSADNDMVVKDSDGSIVDRIPTVEMKIQFSGGSSYGK